MGAGVARAERPGRLHPGVRREGRRGRLLGRFVPAVGEMVEMLYEFDEDFVVDHSAYAAVLGDHATPLDDAIAATVAATVS